MKIKLFQKNKNWVNRHMTVNQVVERLYRDFNREDGQLPPTAEERYQNASKYFHGILADAEAENRSVRAIGSGWSLSKILETNDYLVVTKPFNLIVPELPATFIQAGHVPSKFVFAECGASVKSLNQELERVGKALPTTGASDGQTIVGAVSTGTHGSAIHVGSMPDYVMGMHLITKSNEHIWLEGTQPVVTDSMLAAFMPEVPGLHFRRINDDGVLSAALVSFGSFGIVHGLLLQTVEPFKLQQFTKYLPWEVVQYCVDGPRRFFTMGLPEDPYYFKVMINPFNLSKVIVTTMYKADGIHVRPPAEAVKVSNGVGIDLLHLLGTIDKLFHKIGDNLMRLPMLEKYYQDNYPEMDGVWDAPRFIFGGSESQKTEPGMSIELGVDAVQAKSVVEKILDVAQQYPFVGIVALRYVKKSKAMFSIAKFDTTCCIEIPAIKSNKTELFFKKLWERLDQDGVNFTFHLGQMNNLHASNIHRRWSRQTVQDWVTARRMLLNEQAQLRRFSNGFLTNLGMDS